MINNSMICAALDVGTTTVSAAVIDVTSGTQIETFTLANDSTIPSEHSFEHVQDPARILAIAQELVSIILEKYPDVSCLGFTGQMHGILYVDSEGHAVSPLYTWQDGRGNLLLSDGRTYCEEIKDICGFSVSTGFGLTTHYYNQKNRLVPKNASKICTVMDYLAMHFAGLSEPLIHPSNAASLGLFDVFACDYDRSAINKLGIDVSILPGLASRAIGEYRGIPVAVAIGDNQASVFGSVADEENAILVNYGTGSQVSVISDAVSAQQPLEVRPYLHGHNLICGCALCGGSAYAILEGFFRAYSEACGNGNASQYKTMDTLAECAYKAQKSPLDVSTLFKGTRQDPSKRGYIGGLGEDNFTPGQLVLGTIHGMVNELYQMYAASGEKRITLVASGNAVQKGKVLQSVLSDTFGMDLVIPSNKEEAATGAAMFAALCADPSLDIQTVKGCIKYA